jgi:hypothetical protein
MPTPEVIERRKARDRIKRRKARAKGAAAKRATINPENSKTSAVYRRMLPQIPELNKRELREMLTQAVKNTADLSDD